MSLDLSSTLSQLEAVAGRLQGQDAQRRGRLARAIEALRSADASALRTRSAEARGRMVFPHAMPMEPPGARHAALEAPTDFSVLAADGSHIDVDRHSPLRCYLMNIGVCQLVYGAVPYASLFQHPYLAATEEELSLADPGAPLNAVPLEGTLRGVKRAVEELVALGRWAQELPEGLPALALVDGSLVLWQLTGQGPPPGRYPEFARKALLEDGFLKALEALREAGGKRPLAVAGYISLPGSRDVANALRLAPGLCPYDVANCNAHCGAIKPGKRPCDAVHGFLDRELMAQVLAPGERSGLFASQAGVVRDYYGQHAVRFFYVNVGAEIARVEVPAWVAENPTLLGLAHALVVDQCRRGQGYPVAIQEAHEQAVISGADREEFRRMVELVLEGRRLPTYTSEKQRSKTWRGV
jgi:hypothetical protein